MPAAFSRRVRAAFLPAALSFLVLAAFLAAARRSAIAILLVRADIINQRVCKVALTGESRRRGSRRGVFENAKDKEEQMIAVADHAKLTLPIGVQPVREDF